MHCSTCWTNPPGTSCRSLGIESALAVQDSARHTNVAGVRRQCGGYSSLPVHHSGGGRTLDQTLTPVAGETEGGCWFWLGKPELGERGDVRFTKPVGRTVLINRPPTRTLRSLGPVNFHGLILSRTGMDGEQIQLSTAIVGQHQRQTERGLIETRLAFPSSAAREYPPACPA